MALMMVWVRPKRVGFRRVLYSHDKALQIAYRICEASSRESKESERKLRSLEKCPGPESSSNGCSSISEWRQLSEAVAMVSRRMIGGGSRSAKSWRFSMSASLSYPPQGEAPTAMANVVVKKAYFLLRMMQV